MKDVIRYSREVIHNDGLPFCDVTMYRVKGKRRQPRALGKPTSAAQEVVNERNARMKLERWANANFEDGRDNLITLTFDEGHKPESRAEAKRLAGNFLRRVKRAFEKAFPERAFKYLYVIEGGTCGVALEGEASASVRGTEAVNERKGERRSGKRIHIHLLMTGGLSEARIRELWGMADVVNVRTLQASDKGFEALSKYLTKQGRLTGEHRWYGSRNLDKPEAAELNASISADAMEALARDIEAINGGVGLGIHTTAERFAPVEERYPGYFLASAEAIYIEQFREWVIHIKLYRKDSAPGKREAKRRRAEERHLRCGSFSGTGGVGR